MWITYDFEFFSYEIRNRIYNKVLNMIKQCRDANGVVTLVFTKKDIKKFGGLIEHIDGKSETLTISGEILEVVPNGDKFESYLLEDANDAALQLIYLKLCEMTQNQEKISQEISEKILSNINISEIIQTALNETASVSDLEFLIIKPKNPSSSISTWLYDNYIDAMVMNSNTNEKVYIMPNYVIFDLDDKENELDIYKLPLFMSVDEFEEEFQNGSITDLSSFVKATL